MLDTGTMARAIKQLDKLQDVQKITLDEKIILEKNLNHMRVSRRNQAIHNYAKQATLVENDDLTKLYLPCINLLIKIYSR